MDDEARTRSGLDPAHRREPRGRPPWGRRWPPRHAQQDGAAADAVRPAYAALDLGTNNCRLLIARPTADGFRVVDAFSRIIRLGEGVAASRRISEAAIKRAVEALLVCRDKMRARGVSPAFRAAFLLPSSTAAAPSTMPLELPAVCTWLIDSTSG